MKRIVVVIMCILLSGCYQSVNQYDISRATRICGSVESVVEIQANFVGWESVLCTEGDGEYRSLRHGK